MYEILATRSKQDAKFWERNCGHDYFLSAEESVKIGLADEIITKFETPE